ncbi:MAG TPA: SRPBCC family protein [Steroidobacteraceae bacterium]
MRHFALVTQWEFEAPIDAIWNALYAAGHWPRWWKYVRSVDELQPGDASGVGALRRYTWSSRLPYRLSFEMSSTVVERPHRLDARAAGELTGVGRWSLNQHQTITRVRYDWQVAATRPWMNALAPILAPAFRWNHGQVMAAGGRGLAGYLGVRLLSNS